VFVKFVITAKYCVYSVFQSTVVNKNIYKIQNQINILSLFEEQIH